MEQCATMPTLPSPGGVEEGDQTSPPQRRLHSRRLSPVCTSDSPLWPLSLVWLPGDAEAGGEQKQRRILTIWYGAQGSRMTNEYLQPFSAFQQGSPISPFIPGDMHVCTASLWGQSPGKKKFKKKKKKMDWAVGRAWECRGRKPCGQVSREGPWSCQQDQAPWAK